MQSGTKLVLGIVGLALAAGALAWWQRYETTHRSTTFWGPHFAVLIAQPSEVTAFRLEEAPSAESSEESFAVLDRSYLPVDRKEVTKTPGMAHLRHAILGDRNYRWDREVTNDHWRWCLQFEGEGRTATLLFNEDFTILGRMNQRADQVRVVDCQPMAETLGDYFRSSKIFVPPQQEAAASKSTE